MEAEEKEQLSPVAVMDFPYEDEDEDATITTTSPSSPSFQQTLANIESTCPLPYLFYLSICVISLL